MKQTNFSPAFFGKRQKRFWILCIAATLCLSYVALAQSGRRRDKKDSAAIVHPQTAQPLPIQSILVGGHYIDPDMKETWSNYRSTMAKACIKRLKERPGPMLKVVDAGSMTRDEAFESAKQQTDAYVLWFGYRSLVGLNINDINYVDYLILMPQTAKILTEGRVYPNERKTTVDPGGVMRLPRIPAQRRRSISDQLEESGRLVADRARAKL